MTSTRGAAKAVSRGALAGLSWFGLVLDSAFGNPLKFSDGFLSNFMMHGPGSGPHVPVRDDPNWWSRRWPKKKSCLEGVG